MKALIIIRETDCSWLRKYFKDSHPAMMAICNKPLLGFMVDFAVLNGCNAVRLLMDEPGSDVEDYFATGSRWGIDISYGSFSSGDSIDTILTQNHSFFQKSPLLLMDGFFFVHYDKSIDYQNWRRHTDSNLLSSCNTGSILYTGNAFAQNSTSSVQTKADFALSSLETIDDIFQISMQILTAEQKHYVLPGYTNSEQRILKGRDVEIARDVTITEPVIIGNHVRLRSKSSIGPGVVLGSNVIIDEGTELEQGVVLPGSYVGRNLSVKNKIIHGELIISPKTGQQLQVQDSFLVSSISSKLLPELLNTIGNGMLALLLASLQVVPFLLLHVLCRLQNDYQTNKQRYLVNNKGGTASFHHIKNSHGSQSGKVFRALSLHKFPLLGKVISGKIRLVGNRLLPANNNNQQLVADFHDYAPGVFAYTESAKSIPGSGEAETAERFYAGKRGLSEDSKVVMALLLSRLTRKFNEKGSP
jgi:NDP-sugar pyrophosphorylase family protein